MATYRLKRKLYGVSSTIRNVGAAIGKQANKTSVGRFLWDNKKALGMTAAMGAATTGISYTINKASNKAIKRDSKNLMEEYKKDLDSYEQKAKETAERRDANAQQKSYSIGIGDVIGIAQSRKKGAAGMGAKRVFINQTNKLKSYGGVVGKVGEFARKNPILALGTTAVAAGAALDGVRRLGSKAVEKTLKTADKEAFTTAQSVNPYENMGEDLEKINKKYNLN